MKIIRREWLPTNLALLAIWFANFSMKFAEFATELGFTAADITKVSEWNATVQFLADAQKSSDTNAEGFRKFRENTLFGEKGDPKPIFPSTALPAPPAVFSERIILELVKLVDDIEDSDKYTTDLGAQLGILPIKPDPISPDDWATVLTLRRTLPDMELEIDFVKGEGDGIKLEYQYIGEDDWNSLGNFIKRPARVKIPQRTPNAPESVRLRGRLLKGNTPVGQYSESLNATAQP